ncbi:hypothetical protein HaLaN_25956 [Haematococcus lacustris]|uniref:Uncharacterized protein n=1 Tax=Haematococcus lacustris TaxID=44745 RepID=A0A6A0A403_HAELA|nr:hypothetical protein HaLaN_25956 [Haematococcus lacustris]
MAFKTALQGVGRGVACSQEREPTLERGTVLFRNHWTSGLTAGVAGSYPLDLQSFSAAAHACTSSVATPLPAEKRRAGHPGC